MVQKKIICDVEFNTTNKNMKFIKCYFKAAAIINPFCYFSFVFYQHENTFWSCVDNFINIYEICVAVRMYCVFDQFIHFFVSLYEH